VNELRNANRPIIVVSETKEKPTQVKHIVKAYKYKLRPTVKQRNKLNQAIGCARFIYNWGLSVRKDAYERDKSKVTYVDTAKMLTSLKQQEEYKWLKDAAVESLQQSLRCLDAAFKNFFRDKSVGYPKFKSKRKSRESVKYVNRVHFDFSAWRVQIPKIGKVKLCKNRAFDQGVWKAKTLTVHKDKCGGYWCTVVVHGDIEERPKTKVEPQSAVGIDVGIKAFATLSDGSAIENPKFLRRHERKLARLQRHFSKTQKDSNRREAMRLKIARLQRKIANKRYDFLQKATTALIGTYDTICLESLKVGNMMKNHHLAKSIQDASWCEFKRQLIYKADWHGKNVLQVDAFFPSSKTCGCCGYKNDSLKLSDRFWACPQCGKTLDRDLNAALNIRNECLKNHKRPSVSGCKDVEGKADGLPVNRQDSKPCEPR